MKSRALLLLAVADCRTDSYLHRLFAPENLPNIGLFAAGVVGIFVAISTLRQIRRQTDAIARGQSPYLACRPHGHPPTMLLNEDRLEFEVTNKGLTPAMM